MTTLPIKIRTLTGLQFDFQVNSQAKVGTLKPEIEKKMRIPPEQQRLLTNGRPMNDEQTFEAQNVKPGSTIHLMLQLRGGF